MMIPANAPPLSPLDELVDELLLLPFELPFGIPVTPGAAFCDDDGTCDVAVEALEG